MDRASQVLAQGLPPHVPRTYAALAEQGDVPLSTLHQNPRILICDEFKTHETLEILKFCFEKNIILCRMPSHTSHKLQPCDVAVFSPLKAAYREQVERMKRGGVNTIGKQHFTYYTVLQGKKHLPRRIFSQHEKVNCILTTRPKILHFTPVQCGDLQIFR